MNTSPNPNDHVRHTFFPRNRVQDQSQSRKGGRGNGSSGNGGSGSDGGKTFDGVPLGTPVEVCWLDALSVAEEWSYPDDVDEFRPEPTVAIGYLWQSEVEFLTLITLVNTDNIGNGLLIPRGCITTVRPLFRDVKSGSESKKK